MGCGDHGVTSDTGFPAAGPRRSAQAAEASPARSFPTNRPADAQRSALSDPRAALKQIPNPRRSVEAAGRVFGTRYLCNF